MTAPTLAPPATPSAAAMRTPMPEPRRTDHRLSTTGVLRSEWIKLRSVRSSTMTLLATSFTMLFVGAVAAGFDGGLLPDPGDDGGGGPGGDPTSTVMAGVLLAPLVIGVLGVLAITSEYATGTMRSTMTLVPRRLPVLVAKIVVLVAVVAPVMALTTLATFFAGQTLLAAGDSATAAIGDPGVLRAVLGTAGYLTGVALIGLALGALLRATSVAISVLVALVFLLPGLGSFLLPVSVRDNVLLYLPSNAASSFTTVAPGPELLSPGAGALVLAAWVVVPLLVAAVALEHRPL